MMRLNLVKNGTCLMIILFLSSLHYDINAQTIQLPDPTDCSPEITALDCGAATFNNTEYTAGEEYRGSLMVPYTGGNGGIHPSVSIASTGVTGITADLLAGTLNNGAGNLIFYLHGMPSGAGTASFDISYGGQSCTASFTITEALDPATTASSGDGSCGALHSARSIYNEKGLTAIVDSEGYIWLEAMGKPFQGGGTLTGLSDISVNSRTGAHYFDVPERIVGPYYSSGAEIKFNKVLLLHTQPSIIVAVAEDGNTWAFNSEVIVSTFGADPTNGDIFCKECPNSVQEDDFSPVSEAVGWGRLTTNNGDNIIDAVMVQITSVKAPTILLDENGAVWVTSNEQSFTSTTSHLNRVSGLGANYSRGTYDPSYLPITIPNGEKIVKLASYWNSFPAVFALSETGKVYQWGNSHHGFSWSPTELAIPGGVTVADIEPYYTGLWIQGTDGKLYSVGSATQHEYLSNASYTYRASDSEASGVYEVAGWTDLGVDLAAIPPGGRTAFGSFAFMGTDDKLYFHGARSSMAAANAQGNDYLNSLRAYEDIPNSNLDYSSGVIGVIPPSQSASNDAGYILTNSALVTTTGRPNNFATTPATGGTVTGRYVSTAFPNVDYIQFCYGQRDGYVPSLNSSSRYWHYLKSETIK